MCNQNRGTQTWSHTYFPYPSLVLDRATQVHGVENAPRFTEADMARQAAMQAASLMAGRTVPARVAKVASEAAASVMQQQKLQPSSSPANGSANIGLAPDATKHDPTESPSWAVAPVGVGFVMEVMKDGVILETIHMGNQGYYLMGRTPDVDVVTEHPSCSRHHAAIAFDKDHRAFIRDCGSTHGTCVNKHQLKAYTYTPLKVGDQIKLGQSSRVYIFMGPQKDLGTPRLDPHSPRHRRRFATDKRKDDNDNDDDGEDDDDDDDGGDDFFDRSGTAGTRKRRRTGADGSSPRGRIERTSPEERAKQQKFPPEATLAPVTEETAESLIGRRELLMAEVRRLRQDIAVEESVVQVTIEQEHDKVVSAGDDDLDAFMAGMKTDLEKDKLARLNKELAEAQKELVTVEKYLSIVRS